MRFVFILPILFLVSCRYRDAPLPPAQAGSASGAAGDAGVVFLIDASGSMLSNMSYAKEALYDAVTALPPGRRFGIVVAQDRGSLFMSQQLLEASRENKKRAEQFINDFQTVVASDVPSAILDACRLKPGSIWLVTDGIVDDEAKLWRSVASARSWHIPINTILDLSNRNGEQTVFRIAEASGGICLDEGGHIVQQLPTSERNRSRLGTAGNAFKPARGRD